mgnify:CR=1 FL=1
MAGEYDLTFYNTAGGSFDPATDMSNMAPGAMGDPILCQSLLSLRILKFSQNWTPLLILSVCRKSME